MDLHKLKERHSETLADLKNMTVYEKYLEAVVGKNNQFFDIYDLILRSYISLFNKTILLNSLILFKCVQNHSHCFLKYLFTYYSFCELMTF